MLHEFNFWMSTRIKYFLKNFFHWMCHWTSVCDFRTTLRVNANKILAHKKKKFVWRQFELQLLLKQRLRLTTKEWNRWHEQCNRWNARMGGEVSEESENANVWNNCSVRVEQQLKRVPLPVNNFLISFAMAFVHKKAQRTHKQRKWVFVVKDNSLSCWPLSAHKQLPQQLSSKEWEKKRQKKSFQELFVFV